MKRNIVLLTSLIFVSAAAFSTEAIDSYTKDKLVSQINQTGLPVIKDGYLIFTAKNNARHVGIVFDFENFNTIHSFERLDTRNLDNEVVQSLYFYILEIPRNTTDIAYRLVIDGLWTTDPENPRTEYNSRANCLMSKIKVPLIAEPVTSLPAQNTVKFIYQGDQGRHIRLGGSFTNWDSSIYELKETSPGFYELELPLPKGTYYYSYYEGVSSFIDATNPERAYTADGRVASVITVQ